MKSPVDIIGVHTATGVGSTVSKLGREGTPASTADEIATPVRLIAVSGTFDATIKIEGSLDNTKWFDWITAITTESLFIIEHGPLYLRSNCTVFNSGTATVKVQKYIL